MPYSIRYDSVTNIIWSAIEGTSDLKEARTLSLQTRKLADQYQYNHFLVDLRQATFRTSLSAGFTYTVNLAKRGYERTDRMAIVYAPEEAARFHLMETAAQNRGWSYRAFEDLAEALAWLQEN
ncbi:MAG: STAS/SEC14 domain-containing protein [Bacteroidetes bacterium]|nr:MAG: STAS/SEC14 domain-containing protein [Bacteroidota bacterium]